LRTARGSKLDRRHVGTVSAGGRCSTGWAKEGSRPAGEVGGGGGGSGCVWSGGGRRCMRALLPPLSSCHQQPLLLLQSRAGEKRAGGGFPKPPASPRSPGSIPRLVARALRARGHGQAPGSPVLLRAGSARRWARSLPELPAISGSPPPPSPHASEGPPVALLQFPGALRRRGAP
jgi:hypothetical protein